MALAVPPLPDLPAQPGPLIGRAAEVDAVGRLLRPGGVRLLTLTGPGGVGKTRLALDVAWALASGFPDGAYLVDLSSLRDPALVLPTIAAALGVREGGSARWKTARVLTKGTATGPVDRALRVALGSARLLLVLDNCEQVVLAAPEIGALVADCPGLVVLATSREPLGLRWEHVFPVLPLALPDEGRAGDPDAISLAPAVALFAQRARAVQPAFALTEANARAVAEICRRFDGLPLAIELAAAQTRFLSPPALLARLGGQMGLLRGAERDRPARHQTLHAAIAWSYDLLDEEERVTFGRLAVFAGGCTLEAAERVLGAEVPDTFNRLRLLVDKNLLAVAEGPDGEPRFRLLESVREYALERLAASGELEELRPRHARHYLALAEAAESRLRGAEQAVWLARLDPERDNFRAVLDWCVERGEVEIGLRLGGALWRFWWVRGDAAEGRARLERLLGLAGAEHLTATRAKALNGAGVLARQLSDFPAATALLEEGLAVARQVGDRRLVADALHRLGRVAANRSDYPAARRLCEESLELYRALGDELGIAGLLDSLGVIARHEGRYPEARALYQESLAVAGRVGDRQGQAETLLSLGLTAILEGDLETSRRRLEESLAISRELDDRPSIAAALDNLGVATMRRGERELAWAYCAEGLALAREMGDRRRMSFVLETFAGLAADSRQPERALRLTGAVAALREEIGLILDPAWRDRIEADLEPARRVLGAAAEVAEAAGRVMSLDQAIAYALTPEPVPVAPPTPPPVSTEGGPLSRREVEVVRLIARGLTNKEIAETLVISERTADTHADHIRQKLGVRSRAEIAAWAVRQGIADDRRDDP